MTAPGRVLTESPHDRRLIDHVQPGSWVNPQPARRYNLVVLGAGTAGLVCAAAAAGLGARVALVEKAYMGGDCLNYGCVPSKALIRSSRAVQEIREAAAVGVNGGIPDPDFEAVMERLRAIRADISVHDSVERFTGLGVDVFLGEGCFQDRRSIRVGDKLLRFQKAVVATGARAAVPSIPGLEEAGYLTNETVFTLTRRPRRLLVIGGGPIGCELSQAFARLGSEVTLVEIGAQFLPREDPEAATLVLEALQRDGVAVHLGTEVVQVGSESAGRRVRLRRDGEVQQIAVDEILVGVGRTPNLEGLNLRAARIESDPARGILVNDRLQTTNSRVYAAGDVALTHKFTHAADASARIVIQNAFFFGSGKSSGLVVPWCTYTTPEVARVGMDERAAAEAGIEVNCFKIPFSEVDRAVLDGDSDGFVKILVRRGSDQILGATIVGRHAGELISEVTQAMVHGIGLAKLANVIHPYPTYAESIRKAADAYNRTRLTPRVKRILKGWFRWRR